MKALELYEKMATIRDEFRDAHKNALCDNCNEVFTQLLAVAFTNEWEKDTLPEVFTLFEVSFSSQDIKTLLERIGLNVQVELKKSNYATGNSFLITQI